MQSALFVLAILATAAVAVVLIFGIGTFAKGGEFNKRNSNKIMRLRLLAQLIAVILISAFVMLGGSGG